MSPPSRAAWIEIGNHLEKHFFVIVSPPSRAAWIEMGGELVLGKLGGVAAFTGGVD